MLVLTRKPNESIVCEINGVVIVISLIYTQGDKARLGIEAPREVNVHRLDVWNAIQQAAEAGAAG